MSNAFASLQSLFSLARGEALPPADDGPARRMQLVIVALFVATALAALWGLFAGSATLSLALANTMKVPIVLLLSVACAVPAALVAMKLLTLPGTARGLLESVAGGVFASGLVLGVLSPVVGIYYHTSTWAGPFLGMGSVLAAILVGDLVFVRGLFARRPEGTKRRLVVVPAAIFISLQLLTLVQFIALASPILPEVTRFDAGIDGFMQR